MADIAQNRKGGKGKADSAHISLRPLNEWQHPAGSFKGGSRKCIFSLAGVKRLKTPVAGIG